MSGGGVRRGRAAKRWVDSGAECMGMQPLLRWVKLQKASAKKTGPTELPNLATCE